MHHPTMLQRNTALAFLMAVFFAQAAAVAKDPVWEPLFDGRSLNGWFSYLDKLGRDKDPQHVFTVHDGVIHIYRDFAEGAEAPFGYIATRDDFSHYRLRLEYKWGTKRFAPRAQTVRDSGILYHALPEDKIVVSVWPPSVECQIQENDVGDVFLVATGATTTVDPETATTAPRFREKASGGKMLTLGKARAVTRVIRSAMHETDGWNKVEVIIRGDRATHVVNGHVNNRLEAMQGFDGENPEKPFRLDKGKILLQAEGAEVLYRNVEIMRLDPADPDQPAGQATAPRNGARGATRAADASPKANERKASG